MQNWLVIHKAEFVRVGKRRFLFNKLMHPAPKTVILDSAGRSYYVDEKGTLTKVNRG